MSKLAITLLGDLLCMFGSHHWRRSGYSDVEFCGRVGCSAAREARSQRRLV